LVHVAALDLFTVGPGVAQIAEEAAGFRSKGPRFAQIFLDPGDAAEPAAGAGIRIWRVGRAQLILAHRQVEGDLVFQVLLELPSPEQRAQP
jgi:hypothetical protein